MTPRLNKPIKRGLSLFLFSIKTMNKKSPIEHQFFTLEELIAKLKEKGLKIIDDSKLL